jgi:uncharacterized membrane protein YecN with MAPEG domain
MILPVTALFAAIMALIQFPMTMVVGIRRAQTGIHFMTGDDVVLMRRMRAHGNFTETVPIILLAMAAAESVGASSTLLYACGVALLLGRLVHFVNLCRDGAPQIRALGMILTLAAMVILPGFTLLRLAGWV